MYVKVFRQIFDSSIARNYPVRRMFMELLVLADKKGELDMTFDSISAITRVPEDEVRYCIGELEKVDPESRSQECEGRRLIRLDDHRSWGWRIVNYEEYRDIVDSDSVRIYERERKRKQRNLSRTVRDNPGMSQNVPLSEAEAEAEAEAIKKKSSSNGSSEPVRTARSKSILLNQQEIEELEKNPAYEKIDLVKEAYKFKAWCEKNHRTKSVRRFVNWINRI